VSFKSNLTLIKGSLHAKAVFERAQPRFNACSPFSRIEECKNLNEINHAGK
jgi:hypothetical protein